MALGGCADLRLYSSSLDEQGKKAQKAWTDVNLAELVQAERERSAALLKAEVAYLESQPLLSRDVKLYGLVVGEVEPEPAKQAPGLKARVAAGFKETAGDGTFYDGLVLARAREMRAKRQYQTGEDEFKRIGLEAPSCTDVLSGNSAEMGKDMPSPYNAIVKGGLALLKTACEASADSVPEKDKSDPEAVRKLFKCTNLAGAALSTCLKSMPRLQAELETLYAFVAAREAARSAHVNERNDVRVASATYKKMASSPEGKEAEPAPKQDAGCAADKAAAPAAAASAATSPASAASAVPAGPTRTKLAGAIERLKCAVAKLKGLDDKYTLKLLSEERLSAIDESLDALLSPKAAGAAGETGKDRAGRALQRLADTADAWATAKANTDEVLGRPLLAQQEVERLQQQALGRLIDMDGAEVELLRTRATLTEKQAEHYKKAIGALSGVSMGDGALEDMFLGSPPASANNKARVMEGVAHYGYAVGYLQGQYEGTKQRQRALVTARQLDLAENSLAQWDILIRTNVGLLADWAASGVKEETISRGVNALLLLWIGYGTNHQ
ncbi:hypothetical protein GCM10009107_21870 [Ideonella azotifigens]|uniref:Uncharacterized protein n=2 Tax=Ideonella azotifigens TaxID=513160 RepID=A0ABN1JZJ3_9BURK